MFPDNRGIQGALLGYVMIAAEYNYTAQDQQGELITL